MSSLTCCEFVGVELELGDQAAAVADEHVQALVLVAVEVGLLGSTIDGCTSTAVACRQPSSRPSTTVTTGLSPSLSAHISTSPDMPGRFSIRVRAH
ncbi:hypothetical protein G419_16645 [Rhodococcus triatomae BKS 15-14]|nr:hypothetical protein G419_16645 [Rhodococcus triatomae BKS 15-14]